jgi:hypothetical protein
MGSRNYRFLPVLAPCAAAADALLRRLPNTTGLTTHDAVSAALRVNHMQ